MAHGQQNNSARTIPLLRHRAGMELEHTLDLDAVYGHMPFEVFRDSFQQSINMELDNSPKRVILTGNSIKIGHLIEVMHDDMVVMTPIKELPHVRIGAAQATDFGSLDIYFVLGESDHTRTELKSIVYDEIKEGMRELGSSAASSFFTKITDIGKNNNDQGIASEQLTVKLSCEDLKKVIRCLFYSRFKNEKPLIYFETFGNKKSTISTDLSMSSIISKIRSSFRQRQMSISS